MRSTALAFALTASLALVWPGGARGEGELVVVDRYRLNPSTLEVVVGSTVTFRADEDESTLDPMRPLTLVEDDGLFRSPPLEPGDRWRFTFERSGLYRYHIEEHPGVEGTIVVE